MLVATKLYLWKKKFSVISWLGNPVILPQKTLDLIACTDFQSGCAENNYGKVNYDNLKKSPAFP